MDPKECDSTLLHALGAAATCKGDEAVAYLLQVNTIHGLKCI